MNKTIIIAEAGVNHNGDIETAKRLIDVAADAGVDYVKFQTFRAERLVSPSAQKAKYQIKNDISKDDSQFNMLKRLELSDGDHKELNAYCKLKNISFFSTAFDEEGIKFRVENPETKANYWLMAIELNNKSDRDLFLKETNSSGVMTRPIWQLMFRLPMFENCYRDSQKNAIFLEERIVNIPSSFRKY